MKTTTKTLLLLMTFGVATLVARAQDDNTNTPPGGFHGRAGHRPPAPLIIGALDANHDGVIDATEIANASTALKALDTNGDGKLTRDEFMGRPPGAPAGAPPDDSTNQPPTGMRGPRGHHHPIPAVVRALDANHDGVIDANEIANASTALATLDKNSDGKLTPDEFMGFRPMGSPRDGNAGNPPRADLADGPGAPDGPDGGDMPPQDLPPQE